MARYRIRLDVARAIRGEIEAFSRVPAAELAR
jgi:hypothetical protein